FFFHFDAFTANRACFPVRPGECTCDRANCIGVSPAAFAFRVSAPGRLILIVSFQPIQTSSQTGKNFTAQRQISPAQNPPRPVANTAPATKPYSDLPITAEPHADAGAE